jgi:pimeloyl-ACP methyl ester carboxylesterase
MQGRIHTVETSALNIAYEQTGPDAGVPILLLHGFPYDVREFDLVRDHIAAENRRVLVPYSRGFGLTRYRSDYSFALGSRLLSGKRAAIVGRYERRLLPGVGHCPPAEAPDAVSHAIEDVLRFSL